MQCCRHGRRTVSPPCLVGTAGATLPRLHRCSCNSNGDGGGRGRGRGRDGSNGRRTPSQRGRQRGNYEVVAAALVHLVVRGRDIGLPRSTLPVRYSFPASLMHYTRLSASALCRCLSRLVFPPLPRRFYRFCFPRCSSFPPPRPSSLPLFCVSQYFPFNLSSFSSVFPSPSRSCRPTRRAMFLFHSPRPFFSLYISSRGCDGDEWVRRIVIMRSHLLPLAPPRIHEQRRDQRQRREESDCKREQVVMIA